MAELEDGQCLSSDWLERQVAVTKHCLSVFCINGPEVTSRQRTPSKPQIFSKLVGIGELNSRDLKVNGP